MLMVAAALGGLALAGAIKFGLKYGWRTPPRTERTAPGRPGLTG